MLLLACLYLDRPSGASAPQAPWIYQGFARKASAFMPGMDSAEAAGFHCS